MSPILLLLLGMIVVLGGVLVLKLHPFLALIAGALVVAVATPQELIEDYGASQVEADKMSEEQANKLVKTSASKRVAIEFGITCGKIGILIAMAAIIGTCLLESGAAARIVQSILALLGAARAHLAFLFSGFMLAIPVFFDTVFYLLIPIGKAMGRKTKKNYLLYVLTIVAGATMAHSLIPPTPGPLFVAEKLDVNIGTMMLAGLCVGICTISLGYFYALWANRRWTLEVPEEADLPSRPAEAIENRPVPPLWLALLPVLLPLVLIGLGTGLDPYADSLTDSKIDWPLWLEFFVFLGDKNIALILSALVALSTLAWVLRGNREQVSNSTQTALKSGAVIILITAAGGAFGGVLRQTDIAGAIQDMAGSAQMMALPIVFLVTMLVRTAQGSATVAMITAAPVAVAFAEGGDLVFHPVYLALAIGCGSKPIPWMNDSGFWVITRMSGLRESQTLRIVTPMMSLMGLFGLIVTMIGSWIFPMAG